MSQSSQFRRWFTAVVFLLLLYAISTRFDQLRSLGQTLRDAEPRWLAIALFLQIGYYILYTVLHDRSLRLVNIRLSFRGILSALLAAMAMQVALPGSGGILFVEEGKKEQSASAPRTLAGLLLMRFLYYVTFLLLLSLGLLILAIRNDLRWFIGAGALALLTLTFVQGFLLWTAGQKDHRLVKRSLSWLQAVVNYLGSLVGQRGLLTRKWAHDQATELRLAAQSWQEQKRELAAATAVALLLHLFSLTSLWFICLAFGVYVSLPVIIAVFTTAVLLWIVSPAPQGIGFVEAGMTFILGTLGVPARTGLLIATTFRALTFWLPFLAGLVLLNRSWLFRHEKEMVDRQWNRRVLSIATAIMGLISVVVALTPSWQNRVDWLVRWIPLHIQDQSRLMGMLTGILLLLLASGLARRQWSAWIITQLVLLLSVINSLVKGLDVETAALGVALAVWLWWARQEFRPPNDQ